MKVSYCIIVLLVVVILLVFSLIVVVGLVQVGIMFVSMEKKLVVVCEVIKDNN